MVRKIKLFIIIGLTALFSACSSISINDYENSQPKVNLENFFTGNLVAYGIVRDRSGLVIRHFTAQLNGQWNDGVGTLDEVFIFNDGEQQQRIWTMTPDGKGNYIGTAGDVEGEALIQTRGQAIRLNYALRIPYKDSDIVVSMDDWMYQVAPNVIINETLMTKWGFNVGKVSLVIIKQ